MSAHRHHTHALTCLVIPLIAFLTGCFSADVETADIDDDDAEGTAISLDVDVDVDVDVDIDAGAARELSAREIRANGTDERAASFPVQELDDDLGSPGLAQGSDPTPQPWKDPKGR